MSDKDSLSQAIEEAKRFLQTKTATRVSGVVHWFHHQKGIGFITPDDGGDECFVHYAYIESDSKFKDLTDGDRVSFVRVHTPKGYRAENVRVENG